MSSNVGSKSPKKRSVLNVSELERIISTFSSTQNSNPSTYSPSLVLPGLSSPPLLGIADSKPPTVTSTNQSTPIDPRFLESANLLSKCLHTFEEVTRVKGPSALARFLREGILLQPKNPGESIVIYDSSTATEDTSNSFVYLLLRGKLIYEGFAISPNQIQSKQHSSTQSATTSTPQPLDHAAIVAAAASSLTHSPGQTQQSDQSNLLNLSSVVAAFSQPSTINNTNNNNQQKHSIPFMQPRNSILVSTRKQSILSVKSPQENSQPQQDHLQQQQQHSLQMSQFLDTPTSPPLLGQSSPSQLSASQKHPHSRASLSGNSTFLLNASSTLQKAVQTIRQVEKFCVIPSGVSLSAEKLSQKVKAAYETKRIHTGETSAIIVSFSRSSYDSLMYGVDDSDAIVSSIRAMLETNALFRSCTFRQLNNLACVAKRLSFQRETLLYAQNDPAFGLYFVVCGEVKVAVKRTTAKLVQNATEAAAAKKQKKSTKQTSESSNQTNSTIEQQQSQNLQQKLPQQIINQSSFDQPKLQDHQQNQQQQSSHYSLQELLQMKNKKKQPEESEEYFEIAVLGEGSVVGLEELVLDRCRSASMIVASHVSEFIFLPLRSSMIFDYIDATMKGDLEQAALQKIHFRRQKAFERNYQNFLSTIIVPSADKLNQNTKTNPTQHSPKNSHHHSNSAAAAAAAASQYPIRQSKFNIYQQVTGQLESILNHSGVQTPNDIHQLSPAAISNPATPLKRIAPLSISASASIVNNSSILSNYNAYSTSSAGGRNATGTTPSNSNYHSPTTTTGIISQARRQSSLESAGITSHSSRNNNNNNNNNSSFNANYKNSTFPRRLKENSSRRKQSNENNSMYYLQPMKQSTLTTLDETHPSSSQYPKYPQQNRLPSLPSNNNIQINNQNTHSAAASAAATRVASLPAERSRRSSPAMSRLHTLEPLQDFQKQIFKLSEVSSIKPSQSSASQVFYRHQNILPSLHDSRQQSPLHTNKSNSIASTSLVAQQQFDSKDASPQATAKNFSPSKKNASPSINSQQQSPQKKKNNNNQQLHQSSIMSQNEEGNEQSHLIKISNSIYHDNNSFIINPADQFDSIDNKPSRSVSQQVLEKIRLIEEQRELYANSPFQQNGPSSPSAQQNSHHQSGIDTEIPKYIYPNEVFENVALEKIKIQEAKRIAKLNDDTSAFQQRSYLVNTQFENSGQSSLMLFEKYKKRKIKFFDRSNNIFGYTSKSKSPSKYGPAAQFAQAQQQLKLEQTQQSQGMSPSSLSNNNNNPAQNTNANTGTTTTTTSTTTKVQTQVQIDNNPVPPFHVGTSAAVKNNKRKIKNSRKQSNPNVKIFKKINLRSSTVSPAVIESQPSGVTAKIHIETEKQLQASKKHQQQQHEKHIEIEKQKLLMKTRVRDTVLLTLAKVLPFERPLSISSRSNSNDSLSRSPSTLPGQQLPSIYNPPIGKIYNNF